MIFNDPLSKMRAANKSYAGKYAIHTIIQSYANTYDTFFAMNRFEDRGIRVFYTDVLDATFYYD